MESKGRGDGTAAIQFVNQNANDLLTATLAERARSRRHRHGCCVGVAWLILVPLYLTNKKPLQLWFVAFPYSALLAIIGYLVAQGTKAIRDRPVEL
jgi:hypothetical protein